MTSYSKGSLIPSNTKFTRIIIVDDLIYKTIFNDKVNKDNIEEPLNEWNDFMTNDREEKRIDSNELLR